MRLRCPGCKKGRHEVPDPTGIGTTTAESTCSVCGWRYRWSLRTGLGPITGMFITLARNTHVFGKYTKQWHVSKEDRL